MKILLASIIIAVSAMNLSAVDYTSKLYTNFTELTNDIAIIASNHDWATRNVVIANNLELFRQGRQPESDLTVAGAFWNQGKYEQSYTIASNTKTPAQHLLAQKYSIMLMSAVSSEDDAKIFSTCKELISKIKTEDPIGEPLFNILNKSISTIFNLDPQTYDVKGLLTTINLKLSIRLVEDKAKWEPVVAKVRTYLDTLR